MLVLALDSSTRSGSLALARDGHLVESRVGDAAVRQAVRLPGDLVALLASHGCTLADVDLFAAAAGPGGFTGLRVGLATIQGLAMALDRRVFVASTLDLLALAGRAAAPQAGWIGAWMHGMRGEVFTALYRSSPTDTGMVAVVPAFVGTPDEAADTWAAAGPDDTVAVLGDAWPEAAGALVDRFGDALTPIAAPPLAEVLAIEAGRRVSDAVVPAAVRPAYVRRPDAVLTRLQAGLPVTGDIG
jgi:tRNA threonylcarbamoyladenosine biosynthesis protein TsaB